MNLGKPLIMELENSRDRTREIFWKQELINDGLSSIIYFQVMLPFHQPIANIALMRTVIRRKIKELNI
jgi:hypothetical protein